ncbi:MAG: hypothetical protein ACRD0K_06285 [Egibacteraceae bacterium]
MSQQRGRLREVRRTVRVYNVLVLVIGGIVLVAAARLSGQSMIVKGLEALGTTLVSAALVSFVFGTITIRDTTLQVGQAVSSAMQDTLAPLREAMLADALSLYRWDCHVDHAADDDPLPAYANQLLRISYRIPEVARELRLVCIASSADTVLEPFMDDARYVFRWLVDEGLHPWEPHVFRIAEIRVDGRPLQPGRVRRFETHGSLAVEHRYAVPPELRTLGSHALDLSVAVRKYVGEDRRVRIQTQLFRAATDAEFRLTIGPRLRPVALAVQVSEVSPLGPGHPVSCGSTHPDPYGQVAGRALFHFPLQPGSSVAFTIQRHP